MQVVSDCWGAEGDSEEGGKAAMSWGLSSGRPLRMHILVLKGETVSVSSGRAGEGSSRWRNLRLERPWLVCGHKDSERVVLSTGLGDGVRQGSLVKGRNPLDSEE